MSGRPSSSDRTVVAAWCLYDWANSAFSTLVVTFVYSTYFAQTFADDPGHGTAIWSRGITLSALLIAVLAPLAGVLADQGDRRRYLIGCTLTCSLTTAALSFIRPDQANAVFIAMAVFVTANVAFEIGLVFYNAFLPSVTSRDRIGRISGYGWALGYAGGLACLALAFPFVTVDPPPFGISAADGFNVRFTNLLVAVWILVFSLPMFLFARDNHARRRGIDVATLLSGLKGTLTRLRHYRDMRRFLIARLVYNDGLVTIISFGGIYAAGTFGFTVSDVILFGIVLNIVAGIGAWSFGFVDDRFGAKITIMTSLAFLGASTILASFAPSRFWFWVSGFGIGFFLGPNQSASRSLMGRFVPKQHESEFFGFFSLSGKVTAFVGPMLLGILSDAYSQRIGVLSVLLFFVVGGVLLLRVDEHHGIYTSSSHGA